MEGRVSAPARFGESEVFFFYFQPLHDVEGWACVARTPRRVGDVFHFVFDAFTLFFGIYLFLDISLAHKTYTKLRRSTSPIARPDDYLAESGLRHQIACSNHSLSMLANPVFLVSHLVLVFQRYAERHPHRYSLLCHSVRWGGHLNGIVQTCHPLWWFKYVPQIAVVHTLDTQRFASWVCSSDPPWSHD